MAYLVEMAVRLVELHRVLKPTGSLYLHCDPTASHYLKLILDGVFGPLSFRNEISWKRFSGKNDPKRYGRNHDVILFYSSRTHDRADHAEGASRRWIHRNGNTRRPGYLGEAAEAEVATPEGHLTMRLHGWNKCGAGGDPVSSW
ncbi:MAG: DNA methyltransferase [Candidatus Limnocylindria bacterium]